MISTRALRGAILAALVFSFYPQQLQAEALRNKDFLTWSEGQQAWWLHGAATMAGHIALLRDGDQATCMWNWYFDDMDKKRALVVESARKYPDSTPTAILIALLQRACGKFVPDDPKESK